MTSRLSSPWFDPADSTEDKILDRLTDALVEHLNTFDDYDAVIGLPVKMELDEMSWEERDACVYDPACLAELAKPMGISKVLVGRIMIDGMPRPNISLELIDVQTASLENVISFDSSPRLAGQKKELKPAAYRLFNKELKTENDLLSNKGPRETKEAEMSTGQLIAAISTGVAGVALIGTGAYFGLEASSIHDDLVSKKDSNEITQKDAQKKLDDAQSNAVLANVFYGIGGVAAVVSVVLFIVRPQRRNRRRPRSRHGFLRRASYGR